MSAGLDLTGVSPDSIAVTLKGEAVRRRIEDGSHSRTFGPGGYIDFWGRSPDYPDALYVSHYIYRIKTDPSLARPARWLERRVDGGQTQALEPRLVNDDEEYNFANATADPWDAAMLRYPWVR